MLTVGAGSWLWSAMFLRDFGLPHDPALGSKRAYSQSWAELYCGKCSNTFITPKGTRCTHTSINPVSSNLAATGPCVCARTAISHKLVVASAVAPRVEDGFCEWSGFTAARALLEQHFNVEFRGGEEHSHELLRGADLCVINLTMSDQQLSAVELEALEEFTKHGGTLILNAFSNYDYNGDYLRRAVPMHTRLDEYN